MLLKKIFAMAIGSVVVTGVAVACTGNFKVKEKPWPTKFKEAGSYYDLESVLDPTLEMDL